METVARKPSHFISKRQSGPMGISAGRASIGSGSARGTRDASVSVNQERATKTVDVALSSTLRRYVRETRDGPYQLREPSMLTAWIQ